MDLIVETNHFGDLEQVKNPKVLIIPAPYEYTTTCKKGAKNGSQAILNASKWIESFDEEIWADTSLVGINTSDVIKCDFVSDTVKHPFAELEKVVRSTVISGGTPMVLGGENSLTYGSIKAIYDMYPDISILHFDSRPNLKDRFKDNKYSSQSFMREIYSYMPDVKVVQLGIRDISPEEIEWVESNDYNIEMYFAKDKSSWDIGEILSNLTKNVFISFDYSVFDSSLIPANSNPSPGGLLWDETLDILKNVCTSKEIVGADFVELSPSAGLEASNQLAAKLVYKTIAYTYAQELGAFEEDEELVASEA